MSYEDRISIPTPEGITLELTLAGVGSRFVAAFVDQMIRLLVMGALLLLVAVVAGSGDGGGTESSGGEDSGLFAFAVISIVLFIVQFFYDVAFEVLAGGRTPGKRAAGLRVVTASGGPIGLLTSIVRNLLRLIDFLPASYVVGMVAVFASKRNQRLGDMAAGTIVIQEVLGGKEKRRRSKKQKGWPPPLAAPPDAEVGLWDVTSVTADEMATVRRFLDRRSELDPAPRAAIAAQLAGRLRSKAVAPDAPGDDEAFLLAVVAAKSSRI